MILSDSISMNINSKTKRQLKIQNAIFYVLLFVVIVLLAQVSLKTNISADWTANNRNTLSDTTIELLSQLQDDITIQAFISTDNDYRIALEDHLSRYEAISNRVKVEYINPDFSPDLVRQHNIQQQGEMVISHGQQQTHVFDLSEQSLTNALISVSRSKEQWLIFIEGHGEKSPFGQENFNLSTWGEQLQQKGFKFQALNLIEHSQIPNNTAAIIIASPERPWLDGEISIIQNYIASGGNVLWLADPNTHQYLSALAEQINIEFIPGTVIDPNTQLLGIDDPTFALINDYANHPIGKATSTVTLFPKAVAMEPLSDSSDWQQTSLLTSQDNAWAKTSHTSKDTTLEFELGNDTAGPLSLAYISSRVTDNENAKEQRIAVIGDSDFVSNSYIGNAANLELGIALINWLAGDDDLISIPVKTTIDNSLDLSRTQSIVIGLGFLIVMPIILFTTAFIIWRKRRRR